MFTETWQPETACKNRCWHDYMGVIDTIIILCFSSKRIDSHFVIKISDFGLSEDVFLRNYYREGVDGEMAKLPVKWMAPESLSDGHFSEKSDVVGSYCLHEEDKINSIQQQWSYGVTMWEIFSGGKSPYPGTNPTTLVQMLENGERLPKPYNAACSDEMYVKKAENGYYGVILLLIVT